jgi:PAS domain S-box-containing protein
MSVVDDDLTRRLIDAVPDAVIVTDDAGHIVFANVSCGAMFGYPRAELESQPTEILVPEHRRLAHVAARNAFSRAPVAGPIGILLKGRKKDGGEIPIEVSVGILRTKGDILFLAVIRDARPHIQAEEALRRSEQRYRDLFESARDGVFVLTPEGRYADVNESVCHILGYKCDELVGRSMNEGLSPDEVARQDQLVRHTLGGGTDVSEWELRRKDGTYVTVEISTNALPDGQIRGAMRDISARKRVEEAHRLSEERLARAQSVAHVGSFEWDMRMSRAYRSPELWALFGFGAEAQSVHQGTLADMIHPDDREAVIGAIRDAIQQRRSYRIEHRIVRRDGTERVVLHQGEAVTEGDHVSRIVGTMFDITERKRAETEREESLEELRTVLDQCPVGIILARGAHGEEIRLNARAKALVQRPIDRVGQYPGLLLTMDERPVDDEGHPTLRALRGERFDSEDFLLQRPDGSKIPISVGGAPVPGGTFSVPKAVVAFQDVSVAKDLERLRSEWSSVVAHDLRQPLNSISLQAGIVKRAIARGESSSLPVAAKAAETIVRSAGRVSRMIDDLLDLSRLEARKLTLTRCSTDLPALVESTVELLGSNENEPSIQVRVDGSIPFVDVDPDRIAQVMENLLSNAMKYGTPRRPILVEMRATSEHVHVAVTNEGRGIAPEDLPRLFSRFVRTEDATRGTVKGIGLGLYIAQELVIAHGGEIGAESVPGGRTTFHFTIPIQG